MKIIPTDDYNKRLDKHIKDEFKKVLKLTHPCEHQNKNCVKGSDCPLIGLPNDMCTYHVRGKCKYNGDTNKCKYKHYAQYANVYKEAKEEFKMEEAQPLAVIKRYLRRFNPLIMSIIGIIFSYFMRRVLDSMVRKVY